MKNVNAVIKDQKYIEALRISYENLLDEYRDISQDNKSLTKENMYYADFISWMHLETQFEEFRKNAHLQQPEDMPFPYYTM